jgi:predicted permease
VPIFLRVLFPIFAMFFTVAVFFLTGTRQSLQLPRQSYGNTAIAVFFVVTGASLPLFSKEWSRW